MEASSNTESREVVFYEGRPVEKFSEDQLGRQDFARFFAESIARYHGRESLVLAINAPWGEGKTSFKNMVVDLLAQEHSERVVILNFTPWEWASQNQVSEAFFAEIAKQLELKDASENAKRASDKFRTLGRYLGLTGQIITPAAPLLEGVWPGSTLVTIALGKGLSKAKEVAKSAAEELEEAAAQAKKSLPTIKEDLRSALKTYLENERKLILVIIDDIDRLSPEEIRLVFQMVRVNADFPALVFLLLYDSDFVKLALKKFYEGASDKFLEKIIQFQTDLPVLVDNGLRDHLAAKFEKMFAARPAYSALFDLDQFHKLWATGIRAYITNLRQCGRLLSSYEFHLAVFRSSDAEVNPIDFLVMELFRMFEPALHHAIYAKADRLFPGFDETMAWHLPHNASKDPWGERIQELLKSFPNPAATALFKELFPQKGFGRSPFDRTKDRQEASRQRRLCHILYFNRYFRLTIDAQDISDARIHELAELMDEPDRFLGALQELVKARKLTLALTKLLANEKLRPAKKTVEMIAALCNIGDTVAGFPRIGALVDPTEGLQNLVELHIDKSLKSADRLLLYAEGIGKSDGIHLPVLIAEEEDRAEHLYAKADEYDRQRIGPHLDRADVKALNILVAERLERAVQAGSLKHTDAWIRSVMWYLGFMPERVQQASRMLLAYSDAIAVVLSALITEQAAEQYN